MESAETKSLPENAYVRLKPGEEYTPMVPAEQEPPESTTRAIVWGLLLCVVFTVASAYSGLKVGQVMEAAIPISILAIGLARVYRRRSTVLENVIITSIGGVSAAVVAGAIFTLPALYTLKINPHPVQTIFICLAGACLGVLFLIPLRRYFVREMHGQLPYPEATAITEVLVTGERGGSQAKLLLQATGIAAVYDFFVSTFQVWKEYVDFQFIPAMSNLATKAKIVVRFDAISFILGLGYVMGLRSSMILVAGGVVANFVLVPLIFMIGSHFPGAVYPGPKPISGMAAAEIFRYYVRYVGVGAIATAGIFGIVKSLKVIAGSFGIAIKAFRAGGHGDLARTDRDISIMTILIGVILGAIGVAVFFGTLRPTAVVLVAGVVLTLVFSFFFTSVAANAIATTARNPVSGMTMLTIIISSVVLLQFGVSGTTGMFFVMAIAGMVCTALSVSGQTITDLKTGYWLGSTPAAQEKAKFLGAIAASVAVGITIIILAKVFQFGEAAAGDTRTVLAAPQASIMKALVEGFMSHQPIAYILFFAGAMVAITMEMLGVPALVFALGMYLPLELNTPALVGGFLAHMVTRKSERATASQGRTMRERGVIIASGLMAGGALGGVFGAGLRIWYAEDRIKTPFYDNNTISQSVSIAFFLALCIYLWVDSTRKVAEDRDGSGKQGTPERSLSRGEAEERLIEIARRTVPPAQELTYYFICSGNASLIKAYHDLFRVGAPAYGGSAGYYRADASALSARQGDPTATSLLFAGQESMGLKVKEVPNVVNVLAKLGAESVRGSVFISFVAVGPTGQEWVRKVYATLLDEAIDQGILPFSMYTTASKDAAQFLLDSFSAASPA